MKIEQVQAILLDIEGTTTPVDFVFKVLFPFAHDRAAAFLQAHGQEAEIQADLALLRTEYEADHAQGASSDKIPLPVWEGEDPTAAVPYVQYLITVDRKSTGLKSLQGKIWNQGYQDGRLRSVVFEDVQPAFERWTKLGKKLYIFSSGSIQAQQLLFRYSEAGDLTPYLSGYFDTTTGSKREANSYHAIAEAIGFSPAQILFISDVTTELKAAQQAGMHTLFSVRPGNHSFDAEGFEAIERFEDVVLE
jgi:enolase-phosphatase E1